MADSPAPHPRRSKLPEPAKDEKSPVVVLQAEAIFGGTREVLIQHDGVTYRLRITRRNKLILQK